MSYRPITDLWFLARAKLKGGKKYYGAYLGGFPERARILLGVPLDEPLLHLCGGMAKHYPYKRGFGPNDKTQDIDQGCDPDVCLDAEVMVWPISECNHNLYYPDGWPGILIDPPYSEKDALQYATQKYPNPNKLVENAIEAVKLHGKVGIIHYVVPRCPKNAKFVACVGIVCGFNNRIRVFSVFEKESDK